MTKKANPKEQWNNYSSKYANVWLRGARVEMCKNEINFIKKFISPNTKMVLDVGCGTGRILDEYCQSNNNLDIYGIDIAEAMVETCRKKKENYSKIKEIKVCDISSEPVPYNSAFNLISAIRVFKYNKNWETILRKLLDNCADNGIVIFTMPNSRSINRLANFASTILRKENNYQIYRSNYGELEKKCKNSGGDLLEISSFSKIPDIFYDISKNTLYSKFIVLIEKNLQHIFGKVLFGKELFIAVRKNGSK